MCSHTNIPTPQKQGSNQLNVASARQTQAGALLLISSHGIFYTLSLFEPPRKTENCYCSLKICLLRPEQRPQQPPAHNYRGHLGTTTEKQRAVLNCQAHHYQGMCLQFHWTILLKTHTSSPATHQLASQGLYIGGITLWLLFPSIFIPFDM